MYEDGLEMALGQGQTVVEEGGPPYIPSNNWTEHGQRWHYENWAAWMSAESWADLEAMRPAVPLGTV